MSMTPTIPTSITLGLRFIQSLANAECVPNIFGVSSPSMRRPVDVKAHFRFLLSVSLFPFSQAASVAILPSALFCERYSLGASWVFSFQRCCYLRIDLCSHRFGESWAPGLSRSHLDSAVELGCRDRNSLGHFPHRFLTIAQWFVHLSAYPQPMQQYRQLSSHCHDGSLLGIFPPRSASLRPHLRRSLSSPKGPRM